jgi:hypothetical protein
MKNLIFFFFTLIAKDIIAQGFSSSIINWGAPNGGKISGGVTYGFNSLGGSANSFENTGSQTWSSADMNGDGRPDLIVMAQLQAGEVTVFSPGASPYWKVYLNNGSGFDAIPINWSLPLGGRTTGGVTYGFNEIFGIASASHNTGSQSWVLFDIDGDKKPDLVVTAQLQGGNVTSFAPGTNGQYWKAYINNGSGFNATPVNFTMPIGGKLTGGINFGFNSVSGFAYSSDDTGSQSWTVTDIDGDDKPDLIVTAQLQGGSVTSFAPTSGQYWKVYKNTGSSFNSTPVNWTMSNGGKISGGITYGYDFIAGSASTSDNTGSQSWSLMDLNGDKKPELVITAQLQGGNVTTFAPGPSPYWKVYDNNGSGFSGLPSNWNLPAGGRLFGGINFGFFSASGIASTFDDTGKTGPCLI